MISKTLNIYDNNGYISKHMSHWYWLQLMDIMMYVLWRKILNEITSLETLTMCKRNGNVA